jgi:ABC-2 type transport system permease protein
MTAIYKKELRSYFTSVLGWLFVAFVLLVTGIYFVIYNLAGGYANVEYGLYDVTFVFLIIVPILTMRIMAEEQRQKTDQLLYTAPVRVTEIVLGKYLALLTILAIPMAAICAYPLILRIYGTIQPGTSYMAILGFFLLGAAELAVGMFLSSLTESPVLAAVLAFVVLLLSYFSSSLIGFIPSSPVLTYVILALLVAALLAVFYFLTKNYLVPILFGAVFEILLGALFILKREWFGDLSGVLGILDCTARYDDFVSGLLDVKAVVYYLSVMGLFLFLTVQSVQKRRYS